MIVDSFNNSSVPLLHLLERVIDAAYKIGFYFRLTVNQCWAVFADVYRCIRMGDEWSISDRGITDCGVTIVDSRQGLSHHHFDEPFSPIEKMILKIGGSSVLRFALANLLVKILPCSRLKRVSGIRVCPLDIPFGADPLFPAIPHFGFLFFSVENPSSLFLKHHSFFSYLRIKCCVDR